MKTIGLRELKNRLSEYVREVRSGQTVLVTDRGEVVAELVAPGLRPEEPGLPAALVELARRGQVRIGVPNDEAAYPKLTPDLQRRHAADLLGEERGAR